MKTNFILAFLFFAFIAILVIANVKETDLIGCTELNGSGCVCHNLEKDTVVKVWVEGPESLFVGQTGIYKMLMAGGPAQAGGYNVAGRFGEMVLVDSFSFQHPLAMNELTQAFSLPFPTPQDTIYWEFGYKASDSSLAWDTIYSCGLSIVWDSIPDFQDRWNFGPKFPVKIYKVTDVDDHNNSPDNFVLYQNYPNPFNPSTTLSFVIGQTSFVKLKVFDVLGKEIATLINEQKSPGKYEAVFSAKGGSASGGNGYNLTSGIYYYRLETDNFVQTKKMLMIK